MTPHDTNCVIEMVEEGMTILEAVSLTKAYGSNKMEPMVDKKRVTIRTIGVV